MRRYSTGDPLVPAGGGIPRRPLPPADRSSGPPKGRCRAWLLALLALVPWLGATGAGAAGAAAKRPNIVFILADDMRADDTVATPATNRLVGQAGMTLADAFVDVPVCCPSRATTLTGQYPQNTRVYNNNGEEGGYQAFRTHGNEAATIGTMLHAAGYRTALIGKYLNAYPMPGQTDLVPPGWDDWAALTGGYYKQFGYDIVNTDGSRTHYGRKPADYAGDVLRRRALDFLDSAAADPAGRPFLLYLAFVSPHGPAAAAPRHAGLYETAPLPSTPALRETDLGDKPPFYRVPRLTAAQRATILAGYRQRLRSLASVDEAVAAVVDKLAALGVLDDTYVFFTSDNGFHLGEHQLGVGKSTDFETDIRVPLMVRGPGIRAGSRSDLLVSNVDYSPTFAALAGASPGRPQDGRSLLPVLGPGAPPAEWRTALLLVHRNGNSRLPGEPKGVTPPARAPVAPSPVAQDTAVDQQEAGNFPGVPVVNPPSFIGVRTDRYLFTRFLTGASQFYDLEKDRWELANGAAGGLDALGQALLDRAARLSTCAGEACVALENAPLPGSP